MRRTRSIWPLVAALLLLVACSAEPQAVDGGSYARGPMGGAALAEPPPPPAEKSAEYDFDSDTLVSGRVMAAQEISTSSGGEMRKAAGKREGGGDLPAATPASPPPPAPKPKPGVEQSAAPQHAAEAVAVRAPMLVYTAGIAMTVVEIKASLARIEALTGELGGFMARRDNVSITVRVPVARFDEAVRRIEALGEVIHRNVSVEDVTEEFTDLEVRLQNLRAIRARLEKLLEKAKGVEEAVLLERELGRVAGEIDRIEGRMKLLRDRASYSTITVSLRERQREAIGPRGPHLPVDWLDRLGLGRLLQL